MSAGVERFPANSNERRGISRLDGGSLPFCAPHRRKLWGLAVSIWCCVTIVMYAQWRNLKCTSLWQWLSKLDWDCAKPNAHLAFVIFLLSSLSSASLDCVGCSTREPCTIVYSLETHLVASVDVIIWVSRTNSWGSCGNPGMASCTECCSLKYVYVEEQWSIATLGELLIGLNIFTVLQVPKIYQDCQ